MSLDVGPLSREQAEAAGRDLETEGQRINAALKAGDALAAFIVERALSTREGDNIAIGFDSLDAASIANMALAYQRARGGETT